MDRHIYLCIQIFGGIHTYIHAYIHTYIHTYIYIDTYAHIDADIHTYAYDPACCGVDEIRMGG